MVISFRVHSVEDGGGKRYFIGYCLSFSLLFLSLLLFSQRWRNSLFFIIQPVLITFLRNLEQRHPVVHPFFPSIFLPSSFQLFAPLRLKDKYFDWYRFHRSIAFPLVDELLRTGGGRAGRGGRGPMSKRRREKKRKRGGGIVRPIDESADEDDAPPIVRDFCLEKRNIEARTRLPRGRVKKRRDSLPFLSFLLHETRTRRVPPSSPRNGGQSISSRYALSSFSYRVVPPAHPSSPSQG